MNEECGMRCSGDVPIVIAPPVTAGGGKGGAIVFPFSRILALLLLCFMSLTLFGGRAFAQASRDPIHSVSTREGMTLHTYFPQTDHELQVYHIQGREHGATLMIIGAIQGDETAPYLAADIFADISLKKGNIILIPRANLPSVFAGRRFINQDMNRRFAPPPASPLVNSGGASTSIYEDAVVEVLKRYIHQSDLLLNLHEGGGFYRHTWIDDLHNPMKYGQCLIADADVYSVPQTGKVINLKEIAEAVIEQINKHIDIEEYTYRFNNHNTSAADSKHIEQRKSASYYGLTQAHIPSFGVEVARQLPTERLKKEYIRLIITEFMNYLDIQIDVPAVYEPRPTLNHLLVKVNGEKRYLEAGDVLSINENDRIQVTGVSTNYPRGNYIDIIGHGNKNDINKTFTIARNTEIRVIKDSATIASIPVRVTASSAVAFEGFRVNILDDNSFVNVFPDDTLTITEGAEFEIVGAITPNPNISIRLAGATPRTRGGRQVIDTGTGLSERFAINSTKDTYEFIVTDRGNRIATSYLKIRPIEPAGLHLTHNGKSVVMAPGDTLFTKVGDVLFIQDVELNQLDSSKVKVNFAGYVVDPRKDAEDRGADILLTSAGLIPRYAVNPQRDLYEIHILYKTRRYAIYRVKVDGG